MPPIKTRRPRKAGIAVLYAEIPAALHQQLRASARRHERSVRGELVVALRSYLESPFRDQNGKD